MRRGTTAVAAAVVVAAALFPASITLADMHAPSRHSAVQADFSGRAEGRTAHATRVFAVQLVRVGAYPLDQTLVARVDELGAERSGLFEPSWSTEPGPTGSEGAAAVAGMRLPLPSENRWMSLCATIALGLFFFLRRIV